jgi:hypothetical protein
MLVVEFSRGVAVKKGAVDLPIGAPCIYFLCQKGSRAPFYIGEYGKSKKYNVVARMTRHFRSGTLGRVYANMPKFKNKVPRSVVAHIFSLADDFKDDSNRKSLEGWVIHKACHVQKIQDKRFAVTRYSVPNHDYSKEAARILGRFKRRA